MFYCKYPSSNHFAVSLFPLCCGAASGGSFPCAAAAAAAAAAASIAQECDFRSLPGSARLTGSTLVLLPSFAAVGALRNWIFSIRCPNWEFGIPYDICGRVACLSLLPSHEYFCPRHPGQSSYLAFHVMRRHANWGNTGGDSQSQPYPTDRLNVMDGFQLHQELGL